MGIRDLSSVEPNGKPDRSQRLLSQERVANVLRTMPAAFIAMDSEFRLLFINDVAERIMRRPREELLGEVLWDAFPEALGTAFETAGRKAMAERIPVDVEEFYPPFDAWFEVHAYPVEDGLSAYFTDVRAPTGAELAVQEREARASAMVESAIDCVIGMDQEGRITSFNPAAEETFGHRREEVVGKPLADVIVPPHLRDRHRAGLAHYLETGVTSVLGRRLELIGLRKDGTEFPVEVAITQVDTAGGPEFSGYIRDITNRKRREEERARLLEAEQEARAEVERLNEELEGRVAERTEELEASNRELEAFSYSVSHDLRAPLRAIDGFSRILLKEYGGDMDTRARDYLGIVREGAQQMGRLIDDLLAFSRLGRQPVAKREVDVAEVVRRSLDQLRDEIAGRDLEIRTLDLPKAQADPSLLQQVYINLVANALKFTRNRSPAVIEIGAAHEDGQTVYHVKDNGVGFDMQYADKLFGVFQRMHRAEDYEGTGVGLAIVARVVHRHGGHVWAQAQPEKGATFLFTLEGDVGE